MRDVQQLKAQSGVILAGTGAGIQKSNLQNLSLEPGEAGTNVVVPGSSQRFGNQGVYASLTRRCYRDFESDMHTGSSARCTCRAVCRAHLWRPLSIIHFSRTSRIQHFSFCPEYTNSERSFEFTTHLVPPAWLLSHTINLGFQVKNWRTMKPFSISPIVIGTSRLVDPEASPAFRAIRDAEKEVRTTMQHQICIPRLQNTLQELFDQQKASALDIDCNGHTLLNVSNHTLIIHV